MTPNPSTPVVLVIDDDLETTQTLSSYLETAGFGILSASDGIQGLAAARAMKADLVVLDLASSGMTGLEVCKALRGDRSTAGIPIIILTDRTEEIDRVLAFELGADDYVTKPFSLRELSLRIRSILRRVPEQKTEKASPTLEGCILDHSERALCVEGSFISLTAVEYKVLSHLIQYAGRAVSREILFNECWDTDVTAETRTLDTHIHRLRDKLRNTGAKIVTIRGLGYRFVDFSAAGSH